jgi:hypothetical protein
MLLLFILTLALEELQAENIIPKLPKDKASTASYSGASLDVLVKAPRINNDVDLDIANNADILINETASILACEF